MQVQINSDNIIGLGAASADSAADTVRNSLARFAERLTRVEVHFSDLNGSENTVGADKRCLLEARAAGRAPVAVTSEAASLDLALAGALDKITTVLEREFGRISSSKGH